MPLPREAYEMMKAIVGPENISEDPVVLDSYSWCWGVEPPSEEPKVGRRFLSYRPGAVVLPGSVEEVSGILKVCNRFKLTSKAFSTGWAPFAFAQSPNCVLVDMRRMNRIIDIDEKNMIAVIEPYVCGAQLLAELWKRKLNFVLIGAGPQCSPLASVTAFHGVGHGNWSMGFNDRNCLGVEWVLPTGDILRLGSLGSGSGWFCGDGPGPSLRGIMRGFNGSAGGLGIFTKCAIKLYHWPGEDRLPIRATGRPPKYVWEKGAGIPENMTVYHFSFPSLQKRDEALFLMGEAEIGYAAAFIDRGLLAIIDSGHYNATLVHKIEDKFAETLPRFAFTLLVACNSKREFDYQRKVVNEVLAKTGGEIYPLEPELESQLFLLLAQGGTVLIKAMLGRTGGFRACMAGNTLTRHTLRLAQMISWEVKKKYVEKGLLLTDLGEGCWGVMFDYGNIVLIENEMEFDPCDAKAIKARIDATNEVNKALLEKKISLPLVSYTCTAYPKSVHECAGPHLGNYHFWQKKIKQAFDPNIASESKGYV